MIVAKSLESGLYMDFNSRILPFYMTHPTPYRPDADPYRRMQRPWGAAGEDTVLRDMEYLQQLYPVQVRRYQQRVARILDKMDFEGSVIYDEYPDRLSLERITDSIVIQLQQEEAGSSGRMQEEAWRSDGQMPDIAWQNAGGMPEGVTTAAMPEESEKWTWIRDLVLVLVYNEVYKRRHGGRRGIFYF